MGEGMERERIDELQEHYRRCLLDDVVPFWIEHSPDHECGGHFNCLDRDGSVYSTDKSMLMQSRAIWLFSRLYNALEPREAWLEAAKLGYDFLAKHITDTEGELSFAVTREGRPLERFVFSVEAYAVMACAEYSAAARDEQALEHARGCFRRLMELYRTPGGSFPDFLPEHRRSKELVVPILLAGASREIMRIDADPVYPEMLDLALDHILHHFLKPEERALHESVGLSGERLSTPQGRLVVPGHGIHFSWAFMEEAAQRNDSNLERAGLDLLEWCLDRGWDEEHGGIFNFSDVEGRPPLQLDWDMKPWWSHNEALYATLLAHHMTGDATFLDWYERIHQYTFSHFPDPEFGEWFGYLRRDGSVSSPAKGSMWKSVFHVASSMWQCLTLLEKMAGDSEP
jgi:N-acylglucosamine 2-epimerase